MLNHTQHSYVCYFCSMIIEIVYWFIKLNVCYFYNMIIEIVY
jgi:hypothetical protein